MSEPFSVWAVYDHPKDYPEDYVARRWEVEVIKPTRPGGQLVTYKETPTDETIVGKNLDLLRACLAMTGLVCMGRIIGDDPVIIETWM